VIDGAEVDSVTTFAREVRKKADDFQQLRERAERSVAQMRRASDLERLAEEMSSAEPCSPALPPAKERVLRSLLEMKRSGELENLAQEMADTQAKLEAKAMQLQAIAARMRRSLRDAKRSGELTRLAQEMEQVLEAKMQTLRSKARRSLLRAHRTGELQEIRVELDESLDVLGPTLAALPAKPPRGYGPATGRRWCDMTTSSDSDGDAGNLQRAGSTSWTYSAARRELSGSPQPDARGPRGSPRLGGEASMSEGPEASE